MVTVHYHPRHRVPVFAANRRNLATSGWGRVLPVLLAWAVVPACTDHGADGPVEDDLGMVTHPVEDALASSDASMVVANVTAAGNDQRGVTALERLSDYPAGRTIGSLAGGEEFTFGTIGDGLVLPSGEIAILDEDVGTVRMFSGDLEPIGTMGQFGDGPGEFLHPSTLMAVGDSALGVVDRGRRTIELFHLHGDYGQPMARVRLPVQSPRSGCRLGDEFLVTGPILAEREASGVITQLVHRIDEQGRLLGSFSEPYRLVQDPLVADVYGTAFLACDGNGSGNVWVVYPFLGEVHAFDRGFDLLWIAKLQELELPRYVQTPSSFGLRAAGVTRIDRAIGVTLLSGGMLAVRVESRRRAEEGGRWSRIHQTHLLNARTGEELAVMNTDHVVLAAGEGQTILYREEPFPQVAVVDYPPSDEGADDVPYRPQ